MKILQLTDTHLFADKAQLMHGFNNYQGLVGLIDEIIAKALEFDLVVLTGDLSQDDSEESYGHLKAQIDRLNKRTIALAGNHDNFEYIKKYFNVMSVEDDDWLVIPIASQIHGEVKGRVASRPNIIEEISTRTKNIVILCHHHLLPIESEYMDKWIMEEGEEFLNELSKFENVKLIIHGHVHNEYDYSYKNIAIKSSKATCFCLNKYAKNSSPYDDRGYRLYDLDDFSN